MDATRKEKRTGGGRRQGANSVNPLCSSVLPLLLLCVATGVHSLGGAARHCCDPKVNASRAHQAGVLLPLQGGRGICRHSAEGGRGDRETHTDTDTHKHLQTHTDTHAYKYTHTHRHTRIQVHTHTDTHTYKYTHTYNTHKYTRVHTHIHTHTCKYFHQNLDSLGFELDEDDMAKIAALDRNFHYLRPNDWYGIPLFCP